MGRARLLQWQAQLRGSEQQLRQSVQPRLWLEVLLLGLLAEPVAAQPITAAPPKTQPATTPAIAVTPIAAPVPAPAAAPTPTEAPTASPKPAPAASPELPTVSSPAPSPSTNLPELWQQILGSLELPSTRMLLSQQAQLVRLDANRAVVQVAGNWMGMVQSRASLLEQAVATALGGSRQLILEASNSAMPPPITTPPIATPPIATPPAAVEPPAQTQPAPSPAPAPTQPAPTSAQPVAPELPRTQPEPVEPKPAPAPTETNPQPSPPSGLDRQARNLADFFNGQVLDVDEIS
jgi:DNA polymerase-3 subunit gamma/tau